MLDTGESSVSRLDSRWSLPRTCRLDPTTGYGAGMTASEIENAVAGQECPAYRVFEITPLIPALCLRVVGRGGELLLRRT